MTMSKRFKAALVAGCSTLCFGAGAGAAETVTDERGLIWSLTYLEAPVAVDGANETFRITLGVDTDGYSGATAFIDQVAVKVSPHIYGHELVNAPISVLGWNSELGGINANGCSGSGGGFVCVESDTLILTSNGAPLPAGNGVGVDYSWVFDLTIAGGSLFAGEEEASIKARFSDSDGNKLSSLLSSHITLSPVPEPQTYALMLAGLALLAFASGRRRR